MDQSQSTIEMSKISTVKISTVKIIAQKLCFIKIDIEYYQKKQYLLINFEK